MTHAASHLRLLIPTKRQLKIRTMTIKKTNLIAAALLTLPILFKITHHLPTDAWMRDPVQYLNGAIYVGFFSNLGILCWMAAFTSCAFGYQITRDTFFLYSAAFTGLLMVDDLMLIHDVLVPEILGLPEKLVYALYAGYALWYFYRFRERLLKKENLIFFISLGFLASSVGLDCFEKPLGLGARIPAYYVIEDGLKWMGIVNWACFFWTQSLARVKSI